MKKVLLSCAIGVIGICSIIIIGFNDSEANGKNIQIKQEADIVIDQNQRDSSSIHNLEKYISSSQEEYGEPISIEPYND